MGALPRIEERWRWREQTVLAAGGGSAGGAEARRRASPISTWEGRPKVARRSIDAAHQVRKTPEQLFGFCFFAEQGQAILRFRDVETCTNLKMSWLVILRSTGMTFDNLFGSSVV